MISFPQSQDELRQKFPSIFCEGEKAAEGKVPLLPHNVIFEVKRGKLWGIINYLYRWYFLKIPKPMKNCTALSRAIKIAPAKRDKREAFVHHENGWKIVVFPQLDEGEITPARWIVIYNLGDETYLSIHTLSRFRTDAILTRISDYIFLSGYIILRF